MKSKLLFRSIVAIFTLLLVLAIASCGGSETPTEEAPPEPVEEVVEEVVEEEPAPVEEVEAGICGTTEEVTITYVGDPVDT
ncbi:MAG: hypothetical protein ACK2UM_16480, partial [Anaerolineales bacterium]